MSTIHVNFFRSSRLVSLIKQHIHSESFVDALPHAATTWLPFRSVPTIVIGPQLQQVFLNLINNSLDAINKDGQLDIRTSVGADNIYIEFADTGTGIKPEIMDKIFDPFFTTKEPGKGTGLGMSICYDIMRKLGGKIDIRNREKKGAVFTLTLPIINPGN